MALSIMFLWRSCVTISRATMQRFRGSGEFINSPPDNLNGCNESNTPPISQLAQSPNNPKQNLPIFPAAARWVKEQLQAHPDLELASTFWPLWLVANLFAVFSYQFTTVASATILTSTSTVWTLLLGAFAGTRRISRCTIGSVSLSLFGVVVITRFDMAELRSHAARNQVLGNALALLSALSYSDYAILLKTNSAPSRS